MGVSGGHPTHLPTHSPTHPLFHALFHPLTRAGVSRVDDLVTLGREDVRARFGSFLSPAKQVGQPPPFLPIFPLQPGRNVRVIG